MKTILALSFLSLIGCADPQAASDRWTAYQTDLDVIKQLHKYTCGACLPHQAHSIKGFSKKNVTKVSVSRPASSPVPSISRQPVQEVNQQIYDLSQKIAMLEEALKTNASTTNQNEQLLVQQIVSLKSQLSQIQTASPVAVVTPTPPQETPSGLMIPRN